MKRICFLFALLPCLLLADSSSTLPDGTEPAVWEQPLTFSRTYYVDGGSSAADDNGPGSEERPFRTIGKAAQVLQPGERVVIAEGVYRELVSPARGGSGPDRMISYEAAPGAKVVVKGSVVLSDGWTPSSAGGGMRRGGDASEARIWQIDLDNFLPTVYNPFAMVNAPGNRYWLNFKVIDTAPYFRRRGMVFVDGKPLEQIDQYYDLFGSSGRATSYYEDIPWQPLFEEMGGAGGKFWVDLKGSTIHVRLPNDDSPDQHVIEATVLEQVFSPKEAGLGYIRVKGITFQHSSDPIPLPQSGLFVTRGGNHWIIEDNTIEWANSLCLGVGGAGGRPSEGAAPNGSHIIRNNTIRYCGIGGIEGVGAGNLGVVEKNLVEWIGWQDAERSWEAGGVKFHGARNLLFRNNVIRHMRHAAGFWLDVGNVNCRVTGNIIADVLSVSGAIHMEATHEQNQIDNNVIWGVRNSEAPGGGLEESGGTCFFVQGTDKLIISQNLIGDCETIGVFAAPVEQRIIGTRGGTARDNKIHNNIFHSWGVAAIGFPNVHNETDGNLYLLPPRGAAYLRILFPEPQQWLDIAAWREFYGWEENGALGAAEEISLDPDTLELTLVPRGEWPQVAIFNSVNTDLFGAATGDKRLPGPFADLEQGFRKRNIDPRR